MNAPLLRGLVCASILCLASACSTVDSKVGDLVLGRLSKDLDRTVEIAEKYQSPHVLQCAQFLQLATVGVKELSNEPTEGLFSAALKAAILRRMGSEFEEAFAAKCGGVAARVLLEIGRRAPVPGLN